MTREKLPNRRGGVTIDFEHCYPGLPPRVFNATIGLYPDGRPAEVFVNLVDGSERRMNVDAHDAAVAMSFALQHGADLTDIGAAMLRGSDGVAHGFLGSLADAVARAFPPPKPPAEPAPAPFDPDPGAPSAPAAAAVDPAMASSS